MSFLFFTASIYRDLKAAGYKYLIEERMLSSDELKSEFYYAPERPIIELVPSKVAPLHKPVTFYDIESSEAMKAAKGVLPVNYCLKAHAYVL